MGKDHDHKETQAGHSHAPKDFSRAFAIGVLLNFSFVLVEFGYGLWANSLALMADAGHNLSDVVGLLLAWAAVWLSKKKPSESRSYGLRSTSILASLANAILLLVATGGIIWEAIERFRSPAAVTAGTVIWVAGAGILINAATAMLFASGRKGDLNIRGAYLHMAADALVSFAVVIAGIFIGYTGWLWIDPVTGLLVSAVIIAGTWGLLRESVNLALHAVPAGIQASAVLTFLKSLPGVTRVHDLHIWGMSTTETALTAHLVFPSGHPGDRFLRELSSKLEHEFSIQHTTVQIEIGDCEGCALEPDTVV